MSRRRARTLLPFLVLLVLRWAPLCLGQAQPAANKVDVSGYWQSEGGGLTKLEQHGANVVGRVAALSESGQRRGFKIGEESVRGVLSGKKLSGTILLRYAGQFKSLCPDKWSHWNKLELVLLDANTLTGKYNETQINKACQEREVGWGAYGLKRIAKPKDASI